MYRLLKLRNTHFPLLEKLSYEYNVYKDQGNFGSFASTYKLQHFNYASSRNQSTTTNTSVGVKRTRQTKKRRSKSYGELLIVSDNTTQEWKAPIKKLTAKELKILLLSDYSLDQFYKLRDLKKNVKVVQEHSYSELNSIPTDEAKSAIGNHSESVKFTPQEVINSLCNNECDKEIPDSVEEQIALETLESLDPVLPKDAFDHVELDELLHGGAVEKEVEETEENSKDYGITEEVINRTLSAYVEVCAFLKTPQRGFNTLHFHRTQIRRSTKDVPPVKNLKIYNSLLSGFAFRGNLDKIEEVLEYMREENVRPNVHSFVSIFECLGRINVDDSHLKHIRTYVKEAYKVGLSIDKIMNRGRFIKDQRELVLSALRSYDNHYVPWYEKPNLQYCNSLVNGLNHEKQLEGKVDTRNEQKSKLFSYDFFNERMKEQIQLEKIGYVTVKNIESKPKITADVIKYREVLNDHIKMWEKSATEAFHRDLVNLNAQKSPLHLEPYLRCLPVKDYVTIVVEEAKKLAQGSETYSPTVNQLHRELGAKVFERFNVIRKQKFGILDKLEKVHLEYCKSYADSVIELDALPDCNETNHLNSRQKWQLIDYKYKGEGATINNRPNYWVPSVLTSVGQFLYNIILRDIKIDVNALRLNDGNKNLLPGFYTLFRNQGRIVKEEMKPHPVLAKLYRASVTETLTFPANEVPMRCPPIPWNTVNSGGYILSPCDFIRLPSNATEQKRRIEKSDVKQIYPSMDSLNQLGSVAWKVNTKIIDVLLKVFNDGGSAKLDVPENPVHLPAPKKVCPTMSKAERYRLFKEKLQYRRKKSEMYSLWCDCLYRLSLANHFRDDVFWLPHNMDFRGRVYPIPPHLNHLGSDLARSMLIFAQSRPLGPDGLNWLKLHLINLTGLLKRDSISARLQYANDCMDKILDSADKPLTGKMWWAESEEPWQTLACCMEIAAAHRSPNPEEYRSHFPVHQDGSCNGLQHYAALGRDSTGAFSVNLKNSTMPQDVYSAVVALVENRRAEDAKNNLEVAKVLEGYVKRKVIKQTVMTTVYGVTRFGARLQIARQLKDIDEFPKEHVWAASHYLTTKTFESLRSMFTSTREIQDWFTECARVISSVSLKNVEWITPLGLPVVQPYSKRYTAKNVSVYEGFPIDKFDRPNSIKQKNAFPPNFIHSLDSSHMMLTSLFCERAGIVFVSVHDCFWTHPSTVPIMNKICREQFVALHSEPILENLSLFLTEKFSYEDKELGSFECQKRKLNKLLLRLPETGDFDIRHVLDSVFFFS